MRATACNRRTRGKTRFRSADGVYFVPSGRREETARGKATSVPRLQRGFLSRDADSGLLFLPHLARFLRGRAVPAALEPGAELRPLAEVERERAVESRGDVEIAHRERRAAQPLRFREGALEHVEGLGDLLP